MSKFTCIMLCIVAASLSNVNVTNADAPSLRVLLKPVLDECMKDHKTTWDEVNRAAETGATNIIDHCYSGCVFKKAGFINDKGLYDLATGLINLRKAVKDDEQYNKLKQVATECTTREIEESDEDPICKSGGMFSACLLQNRAIILI